MFDIGFWELMLVGVVALLVVGPEDLPALLRTAGTYVGKARRFISDVRAELDMEVNRAEEIKRRIAEEARIAELHEVIDETKATIPVRSAPRPKADSESSENAVKDKKPTSADHGDTP
ncbi:MAG: twin-arginine translocase subunit TatB [Gammaproteobacteria bacterium]|nr:twin-arginine translocase subunit TatB [Gammaproteobacteria bacterium]